MHAKQHYTFFRRDWELELNPNPSGGHAQHALASVLAHILASSRVRSIVFRNSNIPSRCNVHAEYMSQVGQYLSRTDHS